MKRHLRLAILKEEAGANHDENQDQKWILGTASADACRWHLPTWNRPSSKHFTDFKSSNLPVRS